LFTHRSSNYLLESEMSQATYKLYEHTCRDAGYSPRISPCRACLSQMSKNAVELAQRKGKRN
jgi:hypothetical protein